MTTRSRPFVHLALAAAALVLGAPVAAAFQLHRPLPVTIWVVGAPGEREENELGLRPTAIVASEHGVRGRAPEGLWGWVRVQLVRASVTFGDFDELYVRYESPDGPRVGGRREMRGRVCSRSECIK